MSYFSINVGWLIFLSIVLNETKKQAIFSLIWNLDF